MLAPFIFMPSIPAANVEKKVELINKYSGVSCKKKPLGAFEACICVYWDLTVPPF